MGVAAYNRGSRLVREQIDRERRPVEFELMEELNAIQRHPKAKAPFAPIVFVPGNGGWWAQCPTTGFGYWYRTLREAVKWWKVDITGYDSRSQEWTAVPREE